MSGNFPIIMRMFRWHDTPWDDLDMSHAGLHVQNTQSHAWTTYTDTYRDVEIHTQTYNNKKTLLSHAHS